MINRSNKNIKLYARLIATTVQREKLRVFNKHAVGEIIEYSSRIADDNEKLSTHIRSLNNLIIESDYWAGINGHKIVDVRDVQQALSAQVHRMDRTRELYYDDIYRLFVIIKTAGHSVGQVNALSVIRLGKFSYGHPTRITAVARMGKGHIIDIQREVKMAGPSYSKGGLIISNFISSRYNNNHSLSLYASFSFEQIYGRLDGDSASIAEVCALLSALSYVPIKQSLAVTGSMDQHGNVQSIGAVNQKIEGYFDVCKLRGLDGSQGVIIPAVNVNNLMLREDVVDAVKKKKFTVYMMNTIDEAILLLTGVSAGRKVNGKYQKNSVNDKVEKRLLEFGENYRLERKNLKKE
jgi:predicted ATP-dependent protease